MQVLASSNFGTTGGAIVGAEAGGGHAQIVTHQGATYILQNSASLEDETAALSHTAKASPLTVGLLFAICKFTMPIRLLPILLAFVPVNIIAR